MNQANTNMEPYVTIPDLVKLKIVPLGETKLYELANSGKIPSYRVGKKILVLASEVHNAMRKFNIRMLNAKACLG